MRRKKRARRHDHASAGSKAGELGLQPAYEGVGGEEVAAMGGLDPSLSDEAGGTGVVAVAAMGRLDHCVAEALLLDEDEMPLLADGMTSPMLMQGSTSSDFQVVDIGRGPSPLDMAPSSPAPVGIRRGPSTPHSLAGSAPATPVQTHAARGTSLSPAIVASPEHFALPAPAVVASPSALLPAPLVPENVAAPPVPPAPLVPPAVVAPPLPAGTRLASLELSLQHQAFRNAEVAKKRLKLNLFVWNIFGKVIGLLVTLTRSVWSDCLQMQTLALS